MFEKTLSADPVYVFMDPLSRNNFFCYFKSEYWFQSLLCSSTHSPHKIFFISSTKCVTEGNLFFSSHSKSRVLAFVCPFTLELQPSSSLLLFRQLSFSGVSSGAIMSPFCVWITNNSTEAVYRKLFSWLYVSTIQSSCSYHPGLSCLSSLENTFLHVFAIQQLYCLDNIQYKNKYNFLSTYFFISSSILHATSFCFKRFPEIY